MKIAIAGTGYVGLSYTILLAQHNEVDAHDIVPEKIEMLNRKLAPQPMREDALLTGTLEPTNEPYAIAKIAGIKLCES